MHSSPLPEPNHRPGRDTALNQLLRPLSPFLAQPEVTEVAMNRPGEVWTRSRAGWLPHEAPELSGEYLEALTTAMAVYGGLAPKSLISVVLPGGERGQIVRAPACIEGMAPLTIRKHMPVVRSLQDLETEGIFHRAKDMSFHQPSAQEARREGERQDARRLQDFELELLGLKRERKFSEFLRRAVHHKRNIVIAGKTGSGKTTLARSLIEEVPRSERIVTIEDVHELRLPNHPNRVHLLFGQGEGRVTAEACLAACMRLSPDRIFLAELRGGEAWEYLQSLNTGHPGSITTTHANGAAHAFARVESLVKNSDVGRTLDRGEVRRVLHATLDV
ncbi:MAG TPA: P-type DNA transfer ATPase VirB11, partial [Anaeromyxobacteraceae bacterium]|nr:P-type DNA transfer ATPase VirB11 [Anaeromyxobacteraceae bacterium]